MTLTFAAPVIGVAIAAGVAVGDLAFGTFVFDDSTLGPGEVTIPVDDLTLDLPHGETWTKSWPFTNVPFSTNWDVEAIFSNGQFMQFTGKASWFRSLGLGQGFMGIKSLSFGLPPGSGQGIAFTVDPNVSSFGIAKYTAATTTFEVSSSPIIPEPSPLILLLIGIIGTAIYGHRRSNEPHRRLVTAYPIRIAPALLRIPLRLDRTKSV